MGNIVLACFSPSSPPPLPTQHWQYDGEVICFKDPAHIALGLLAILVLAILVLLSPALFLFTNIANSRKLKQKVRSSSATYRVLDTASPVL